MEHVNIKNTEGKSLLAGRQWIIKTMGAATIVLAMLVLVGWYIKNNTLIQIFPSFAPMQYNVALGFLLSGLSIFCIIYHYKVASQLLAGLVMLIGGVTVVEYLVGINIGLDQLFMQYHIETKTSSPGRMAPHSALCFVLVSMALLVHDLKGMKSQFQMFSQEFLGFMVLALSSATLLGYITETAAGHVWGDLMYMAIHTALGFVFLSIAVLAIAWQHLTAKEISSVSLWIPTILFLSALACDLYTPLSAGIFYIPIVFSALWFRRKHMAFTFAFIATVLSLISYLTMPETEITQEGIFINRIAALLALWVVATVIYLNTKKARTLEDRHHQLTAVLNTVMDCIITVDEQGTIESFNAEAQKVFGYTEKEIIGKNINTLMNNDMAGQHNNFVQHYLETGQANVIGVRKRGIQGKRKNGTVFPGELGINECWVQDKRTFVGTIRDVTERTQIMEALHRSEEQLYLAMTGMTDGVWDWNIVTDEIYSSFGFARMLGYEEKSFPSKMEDFILLVSPDDRAQVRAAFIVHLGTKTTFNEECRLLHYEGHYIWVNIRGQAIWDDNGRGICMTGFVTDITQKKNLEQMKSDFVAIVSHELRTPLTSIRGALGMVVNENFQAEPQQIKELMGVAYKNSERLMCLINDLLDVGKMESGAMEFLLAESSLALVMQQTVDINKAYATKYQVNLVLKEPLPEAKINIDTNRFMQALTNLIANAVKFSPKHGEVTVACEVINDNACISVTDHGPGIPEDFQSRIFQKFAQASTGDERSKGGTGLGLSITKSLVEKMGGLIHFKTFKGKGTTFYIEFPVAEKKVLADISNDNTGIPDNIPCVLVCEDDHDVAHLIRYVLMEEGIHCDIANTLEAARKLLKQKPYMAMTLDIKMPDGDGLDFLKEYSKDIDVISLPVIVVSIKEKLHTKTYGNVIGWVEKPIDIEALKNLLQKTIVQTYQLRASGRL